MRAVNLSASFANASLAAVTNSVVVRLSALICGNLGRHLPTAGRGTPSRERRLVLPDSLLVRAIPRALRRYRSHEVFLTMQAAKCWQHFAAHAGHSAG